jgi:hypothetical protein
MRVVRRKASARSIRSSSSSLSTCSSLSASPWTAFTKSPGFRKVELEQAAVADHLERDALAGRREQDAM